MVNDEQKQSLTFWHFVVGLLVAILLFVALMGGFMYFVDDSGLSPNGNKYEELSNEIQELKKRIEKLEAYYDQ